MTGRILRALEDVPGDLQRVAWGVEDNGYWYTIDSKPSPYPGPGEWVETRGTGCLAARSDMERCEREPHRGAPFCEFHFGNAWRAMVALGDEEQRAEVLRIRKGNARLVSIMNDVDSAAYEDARALLERSPERVYFFRAGHAVKVGRSINVDKRVKTLGGTLAPDDVDLKSGELLGTIPGDSAVERSLHRHFAAHRLVGEWFTFEPIADQIAGVISEQVAA